MTDAVIEAARILREGKWPQTAPACAFHAGRPDEVCRRCGAPLDRTLPERRRRMSAPMLFDASPYDP